MAQYAISYVSNPSGSFTRPADTTAYASGDLVANSTTAGSVVPISLTVSRNEAHSFFLHGARLRKSGTGITNAAFYVHLYRDSPTPTNGDNGAWLTTRAGYLGAMSIASMVAFSDGAVGFGKWLTRDASFIKLTSGRDIYALIEARGAYTPASGETFELVLDVVQD